LFLSPKGWFIIARGNAPGIECVGILALKGRFNKSYDEIYNCKI